MWKTVSKNSLEVRSWKNTRLKRISGFTSVLTLVCWSAKFTRPQLGASDGAMAGVPQRRCNGSSA